jgi:hypothetical protein
MKKLAALFFVFSIILAVTSYRCFADAFDFKENYYLSEDYPSLNKHAYVGGDAYNYIINGTYFAGYAAMGSAAGLGSVICLCGAAFAMCFSQKSGISSRVVCPYSFAADRMESASIHETVSFENVEEIKMFEKEGKEI